MNLIKDIRLFEKREPDVDYSSTPYYMRGLYAFDDMDMQDIIQRLLFLLRHEGFTFGSFDHLYMNYTPSLPHGEVRHNQRSRDYYHPWYRYTDAGCDIELFKAMPLEEQRHFLSEAIRKAVHLHADEENDAIFERCYEVVMERGADLEIPYREKTGEHLRIIISTTISDDVDFLPIVRIFDRDGSLLHEAHLRSYGRDEFILQFRSITIGKKTVRIQPSKRTESRYYDIHSLKFTL